MFLWKRRDGIVLDAEHPLVFVHIPKTAGTSLTNFLHANFRKHEIAPLYRGNTNVFETRLYSFYSGHVYYRNVQPFFPNAHFITFLRDPVERVYSQYRMFNDPQRVRASAAVLANLPPERAREITMVQEMSFDEFVLSTEPRHIGENRDLQTMMLSSRTYDDQDFLESAKENLKKFTFVGLQESFDESIERLREKLQFKKYKVKAERENRDPNAVSKRISLGPKAQNRLDELLINDKALYDFA